MAPEGIDKEPRRRTTCISVQKLQRANPIGVCGLINPVTRHHDTDSRIHFVQRSLMRALGSDATIQHLSSSTWIEYVRFAFWLVDVLR
jgi:hypothetical protein